MDMKSGCRRSVKITYNGKEIELNNHHGITTVEVVWIIIIILKAFGLISWPWWIVLLLPVWIWAPILFVLWIIYINS